MGNRLADEGGKEVAGLVKELKLHAERLEKRNRQLEKEAKQYKPYQDMIMEKQQSMSPKKQEAELGHLRNFMLARRHIMSTREDSADVLSAMVQCVNMGRWDVNSAWW